MENMPTSLSRKLFLEAALCRDDHRCVICGVSQGVRVQHILDQKLWPDNGYYLENAATLCEEHQLAAEYTTLSAEKIRQAAGIKTTVLPPQLTTTEFEEYDKWGNLILPNKTRLRGELFFEEACQTALAAGNVLHLFGTYCKYPKTLHLPWSPSLQNDDRRISTLKFLEGEEIVVSLKMDGENTSAYRDHVHARSLDSQHHPSRSWMKAFHSAWAHEISEGWRICGENLYATHSIHYEDLESYFLVFNIWDNRDRCLSWDETLEWCQLLGLTTVPILYRGPWNESKLHEIEDALQPAYDEGYVVRVSRSFKFAEFSKVVTKFVRKGHVQTDAFWMNKPVIPNRQRGRQE